jgi:hypothetical protein
LGWHLLRFGEDVVYLCLGSKHAFCFIAVSFSFSVFLVGVLDRDVFVHEILPVHVCDRVVGGFECAVGDEAVAFAEPRLIPCNLRGRLEGAEAGECVVEGFLVDEGVEVSNEELGANFDGLLLVRRGLFHISTSISFTVWGGPGRKVRRLGKIYLINSNRFSI